MSEKQPIPLCVECQTFPVHGITDRCKYCAQDKYVGPK